MDVVYNYLNQDPVLHMDMLEALRHDEADVLQASEKGVLLKHRNRGLLLLSVRDVQTAKSYLLSLNETDVIVARQDFCLPLADALLHLDYAVSCIQHAYLKRKPLILPELNVQVKPLTVQHLPFVMEHYSLQLDEQYLIDRLQKQAVYGIIYQRELAGFAGFHSEGSLGMLEILPEWRQKGLGYYLQVFMTNLAIRQGRVPFCQVKEGNEASMRLQQKAGFTAAQQPVYWLLRSHD